MDAVRPLSKRCGRPLVLAASISFSSLASWACGGGAEDGADQGPGVDEGAASGGATSGAGGAGQDLAGAAGGSGSSTSGSGGSTSGSGGSTWDSGGGSSSGSGGMLVGVKAERLAVSAGSFPMGRSDGGTDACPKDWTCSPAEMPEHEVSTSAFWLDRFEVTVARFRPFYEGYPPELPAAGAGAHPQIEGSGWQASFAADLPASREQLLEELACDEGATFDPASGPRDAFPLSCVSWPLALLFCLESGGRLPTEAEWEHAATGGSENRLYPWGDAAPDAERASFFPSDLGPTGEHHAGRGRYGHEDLAGSVWEWTLDWLDTNWYSGGGADCTDCARVSSGTHRALRGGAHGFEAVALRAAVRSGDVPTSRKSSIGFRCAYDSAE